MALEVLLVFKNGTEMRVPPEDNDRIGRETFRSLYLETVPGISVHSVVRVEIPPGATVIYSDTFAGWSSLVSVTFPEGLLGIGSGAFKHCTSLLSVAFPKGLRYLSDEAFKECESLTSVFFPWTLRSIGSFAFQKCEKLVSVEIQNPPPSYFFNLYPPESDEENEEDEEYDENVIRLTIESYAFYGCVSLSSVSLPATLERVSFNVFYDCGSLTSLMFPTECLKIHENAIKGCSSLATISVSANLEPIWPLSETRGLNVTDLINPDDPDLIPEYPNMLFVLETSEEDGPTLVHVTPKGRRLVRTLFSSITETRRMVMSRAPITDNITIQVDRVPRLPTTLQLAKIRGEDRSRGLGWDTFRKGAVFYLNVFGRYNIPAPVKEILLSMLYQEFARTGALYDWTVPAAIEGP